MRKSDPMAYHAEPGSLEYAVLVPLDS